MYQPHMMASYYHDGRSAYPFQAGYGLGASFPYRPHARVQMPMPMQTPELSIGSAELHQHLPQPQQHHHIAHHHQLLQPHHHHHHQQPTQLPPNMAGYMQSDEDLAELQKLSNEYEPEVTGPFVGERQSTSALATEYAAADPVYRAKTEVLPQRYSHYRTIRGDGRCGWRAIAFGYFESLLRLGDKTKLLEEETRLKSFNNIITLAGYDQFTLIDFADETYDLLRKCRSLVNTPNGEDSLVQSFNDESVQNGIITHLKHLTAAYVKTRAEDYAPYMLPYSVSEYCDQFITAHNPEIDHPGISALADVLLKPAGIALDIIYLDRSTGSEVNAHEFAPGINGIATIRLLYRPGHYDVLYKYEDLNDGLPPPSAHHISAPTYLQYATHYDEPIMDVGGSDVMTMIPGMSLVPNQSSWMSNSFYAAPEYTPAPPLPVQHHAPPPVAAVTPAYIPAAPVVHQTPIVDQQAHENSSYIQNLNRTLLDSSGMFRASSSMYQNQAQIANATAHNFAIQTAQFRNSHFNTSHFNNPDFHPEEYDPEIHFLVAPSNRLKSRRSG